MCIIVEFCENLDYKGSTCIVCFVHCEWSKHKKYKEQVKFGNFVTSIGWKHVSFKILSLGVKQQLALERQVNLMNGSSPFLHA